MPLDLKSKIDRELNDYFYDGPWLRYAQLFADEQEDDVDEAAFVTKG